MSTLTSFAAGTLLMTLAFVMYGWAGFAFLPLTLLVMVGVKVAFEI